MRANDLTAIYLSYIDCLNARDWDSLGSWVGDAVSYNGSTIGLGGYRAMLERDVAMIPDLRFNVALLLADPPYVAARLTFDCTPVGKLFGFAVDGRRVQFEENVFYRLTAGKIIDVRSVIDQAAIARQIE